MKKTPLTFAFFVASLMATQAASIALIDLSSETADETYLAPTSIAGGDIDGPYSTNDVTLAFTADFGTISSTSAATLFEFGGGTIGSSLIIRESGSGNYELVFTSIDGGVVVGGNGTAFVTEIAENTNDVEIVVSIDVDPVGSASVYNLFIGGTLIATQTAATDDWAGSDGGGFDTRNGTILAANGSGQGGGFVGASGQGVTYDTELKLYSDVFVATVPEPSSTALLGLGGITLILRRRK